jgi:hypothetical protein
LKSPGFRFTELAIGKLSLLRSVKAPVSSSAGRGFLFDSRRSLSSKGVEALARIQADGISDDTLALFSGHCL